MAPDSSLPHYRASSPPPFYSAQLNEGEEVLAASRVYHTPTGSFTTRCGNVTVVLSEQNEDIDIPVYHRQGLISGTISLQNAENVLSIALKVEGKLKLNVYGRNAASGSVKVVDECYELWSKSQTPGGNTACPEQLEFSTVLPPSFRDGGRNFALPPSHDIPLMGVPGLYSQCTYSLRVVYVVRGSLWNKTKTFYIPFKYRPRARPTEPLISPTSFLDFHATIKSAPDLWFETSSVLQARPSSDCAPVEAQLFIPSGRRFGLADKIPFHIQLTSDATSLRKLYCLLQLEHVIGLDYATGGLLDSGICADPDHPSVTYANTRSGSPDAYRSPSKTPPPSTRSKRASLPAHLSDRIISISVSLTRQVCVDVRDQVVWKSLIIGEGRVDPLPPSFLDVGRKPCSALPRNSENTEYLDWAGEIQCRPDVEFGHFDAGKVKVTDFLVLKISTQKPSDVPKSPFMPLTIAVPISLVSDSFSEQGVIN